MIDPYTYPKEMPENVRREIVTTAFCAYIMHVKGLNQPDAMRETARLCTLTQLALFGDFAH